MKTTLITISLGCLSLTALGASLSTEESLPSIQQTQDDLALALEQQTQVLQRLSPMLDMVYDRRTADRYAAQLRLLVHEYEKLLLKTDMDEVQLSDEEKRTIEAIYADTLSPLQNRVEGRAVILYEEKKCYGSPELMQAIFPLVD